MKPAHRIGRDGGYRDEHQKEKQVFAIHVRP
jgi:hypothetical protein